MIVFALMLAMVGDPIISNLDRVTAAFPERARERGLTGFVELSCSVADDRVFDCSIQIESVPGSGFGREALGAARRLRFEPIDSDGYLLSNGRKIRLRVEFGSGQFEIVPEPRQSGLEIDAVTSSYRVIYGVADGLNGKSGSPMADADELHLIDVGNMKRVGSIRYLPIIHVAPASLNQPEKAVIAYHVAEIDCLENTFVQHLPIYENAAGPVGSPPNWPTATPRIILGDIGDVACRAGGQGSPLGALTRDEILNLLNPRA